MLAHRSSLLDDNLLKQVIDPNENNHMTVEVYAIDTYWIYNTDDGTNFLIELSNSRNMEFFQIEAVQTIIDFLWQDAKI